MRLTAMINMMFNAMFVVPTAIIVAAYIIVSVINR